MEEEQGGADGDDGRSPLGEEDDVSGQVEHIEEVREAAEEDEGDEERPGEPEAGVQVHHVPAEGNERGKGMKVAIR